VQQLATYIVEAAGDSVGEQIVLRKVGPDGGLLLIAQIATAIPTVGSTA
jgi:hypothetical protein